MKEKFHDSCFNTEPPAVAPAELLMGRKSLSRLDLFNPDVGRRVEKKRGSKTGSNDVIAMPRRDFSSQETWCTSEITAPMARNRFQDG